MTNKKWIATLAAFVIALTVIVTPPPQPCCTNHNMETDACATPPITRTILPGHSNG